jgi:DNA-binding IclR family transcriptional regulator
MTASRARDPVGRALDLLTWLAEHSCGRPLGLREIARATGLPPSSVHRLLQTFEEHALVRRDENGAYRGGLELVRLGRLAGRFSVGSTVRPVLERLAAEVDETSMLGMYDPGRGEVMVTDAVQTSHLVRYVVELDTWRPLVAGAAGLGILAFLGAEERSRVLAATELRRVTESTLTTVDAIEEFCTRVRGQGYALTRGQRTAGAVGIAVPIRDADAQVAGDLCLTMPDNRFREEDERRYAKALRSAAEEVSGLLTSAGYRLGGAPSAGR